MPLIDGVNQPINSIEPQKVKSPSDYSSLEGIQPNESNKVSPVGVSSSFAGLFGSVVRSAPLGHSETDGCNLVGGLEPTD